ncbi:response regulator, partial [Candidatus Aerophobetes bacterium]
AFAMPIIFYSFVRSFLEIKEQKVWLYLGIVLYISVFIANVMGYVVKEAYISEGIFYYEIGIAALFAVMGGFLFIGLATFNLIQSYRKKKDSFHQNRLKYFLIGVLIMAAGTSTNFTKLGRYPLDILINTLNAFLIAYVILRYKLLDINIVIRKGSVYFALSAIIASVYLFMIFTFARALQGVVGISVVAILIAIGIALLFQPLRERLQRWVDRLFFRERLDYYQILKKFAQGIVTILDFNELIYSTMSTFSKTMQTDKVAILLINEEGQLYSRASLGLDVYSFRLKKDNPLLTWMREKKEILTKYDIDLLPELKGLGKSEAKELERLKAELFIPLITRDKLIGVITLGEKLSEKGYSEEEQTLLSTAASQASVAFENARLYEELVRSERLRALGEMAGGVAHHFNNLLAVIVGNTQLLSQRIEKMELNEIKRKLKIIEASAFDGAETVKRIQEFSRVKADKRFTRVDLKKIVEDAVEITRSRWKDEAQKKGITITLTTSLDELPPVFGNASELREVITNIIINAIDAMPEGGRIAIKTKKDEDQACILVTDTGPGISEEVKRKIFDPYFTTKGPQSDGLGMSVSHGTITRHEGEIEIHSEEKKGTTITVKLPIPQTEAEKKKKAVIPEGIKKATILVVDDEDTVREALEDMLAAGGHRVISSSSAKEGIELFKKEKVDLVFTDLGMPEIPGWQLAKLIKEIEPRTPVIMITGWGIQVTKEEIKESSVDFFIAKPFREKELLEIMAEAMKLREKGDSK